MSETIRQIAARIRNLREIAGLSKATLAAEFNLDVDTYSAYESGEIDMPVSFLIQVCKKFNVEMTSLLTGREPHLHIYSIVRAGQGLPVERSPYYHHQSLGYNFAHKKAEPFLVTVEPNENEPLHYNQHPGQEFHYVLEGRLLLDIDGHTVTLDPGDSIFFDSTYKHALKAMDGRSVRCLVVVM
ncbi:MAG: XRE family transcriptional regulator [candidate division KSB1 bacterium]|nr:XRE family transcriptional regulator [candidate division KSB1 bacterium]MDZ7345418.1 XRE family transcriptional regulator [candidate division KSB1 bacterium]